MYTSTMTRPRTLLAAPFVACTIGMNTPSTSIVTRTVASAAKLGAALRRIERIDSRRKKPSRIV
jgi:5,10-methylenetetrahydrofolate reductase